MFMEFVVTHGVVVQGQVTGPETARKTSHTKRVGDANRSVHRCVVSYSVAHVQKRLRCYDGLCVR